MATTLLYPYTTLAAVKLKCGIGDTDTSKDELIKQAINRISRLIDKLTGLKFYQVDYTSEYLNGTRDYEGWQIIRNDNGGFIYTPYQLPIISVTTLTEDGVSLTENTDFYLHKTAGMIEKVSGNWSEYPREILITCSLGYASDDTATPSSDIPGDIQQYALELAAMETGHYKKAIKNYVTGAAETVDINMLGPQAKDIFKALRALRPVGVL